MSSAVHDHDRRPAGPAAAAPAPDPPVAEADLASRCAALGLPLLSIDARGEITDAGAMLGRPVDRALLNYRLFAATLRRQADRWADQPTPAAHEPWPGCWLMPVPRVHRRRRVGYHVAILLTADLPHSEQFHQMCGLARLDHRALADRLAAAPAYGPEDIARIAGMLNWMAHDLHRLDRQTADIAAVSQQLGETYEELSLLYELSARMTIAQEPADLLESACEELRNVVGLRWVALQLSDQEAHPPHLRGETLLCGDAGAGRAAVAEVTRALLLRFGTSGPSIVDDTSTLGVEGLPALARHALIVPLVREGRPLALLCGADKVSGADLSSVDSKLLTSAAHNMAIFLENAMLYEDLQDMFMGMLRSLIRAIDAKDTYTRGHSERVAWLSRQLAEAAGLNAQTVERVHLSALVHDVGKIGVPGSVLRKPGKLTDSEFDMVKAHPEIGARILQDIRQMSDLLPGVLHHHERYDGRGYPHRLAGRDIPLFGRLICLADSFDAMSSDRTYRPAMSPRQVLDEIRRCAGTQFDPELAHCFLQLDFDHFDKMLREHKARQSPLDEALRTARMLSAATSEPQGSAT